MKYSEQYLRVKNQLELLNLSPHSYGMDQQSPISFWEFELDALIDAALKVPTGDMVNFGSFYGGSVCLFLFAVHQRQRGEIVHSVDIKHSIPFYRNVVRRTRLSDYLTVHDVKSCDYQHNGNPISFTLSDSWHDFKTVLSEFQKVDPYLIKGGVFAIHDCEPDVYANIEFYKQRYQNEWDRLTQGSFESVNSSNKAEYHKAEALQDFEHGAAIAYILDHYPYELVKFGPSHYSSMESITGPWQRGKVSPVSSLVFLRKIG